VSFEASVLAGPNGRRAKLEEGLYEDSSARRIRRLFQLPVE
jgi:hypothetical protein